VIIKDNTENNGLRHKEKTQLCSRFLTDSRSEAVWNDWNAVRTAFAVLSKNFLPFRTAPCRAFENNSCHRTAVAVTVRSKKNYCRSNGSCRPFNKIASRSDDCK